MGLVSLPVAYVHTVSFLVKYNSVVLDLRRRVHMVQEVEVYEQMLLRGSQLPLEPPPHATDDLDALMQSLMPKRTPVPPSIPTSPAPPLKGASENSKPQPKPASKKKSKSSGRA